MTDVLIWYLTLGALGLTSFPIAYHLFQGIPSRGVSFARPLGLLLTGFVYWLLGTLGFLGTGTGSALLAWLIVACVAVWRLRKEGRAMWAWMRLNRRLIVANELLFLIGFALIAMIRASDPAVSGTEKPMEMMFINSILRSETFPPIDGWLSGYSISYYYFGYIMAALLVRLSGVPSAVGFNLMLATVFAMAATGATELTSALLAKTESRNEDERPKPVRLRFDALWAPFLMLVAGNLEGLFESLHAAHLFRGADGSAPFWTWLGIKELTDAPIREATLDPTGRPGIWWWRASRVLQDVGLDGGTREVIDEFPFFSFFLGDLHPHVIAIPFVVMMLGLAYVLYLRAVQQAENVTTGLPLNSFGEVVVSWRKLIRFPEFWLYAVVFGAAIFINTWDFPFTFAICIIGIAIGLNNGLFPFDRLVKLALFFAVPFGVACLGLYALFLEGLASQAGGFLPSGVYTTRTVHFFVMFGSMVLPVGWWMGLRARGSANRDEQRRINRTVAIVVIVLLLITAGLFALLTSLASGNGGAASLGQLFLSGQGAQDHENPFGAFLQRRVETLPTTVWLAWLIAGGLALLTIRTGGDRSEGCVEGGVVNPISNRSSRFVGLMVAVACGLILVPEFFYLRDFFGTRMNTIFKFYYQAWLLLSIAAAVALNGLQRELRGWRMGIFRLMSGLLLIGVSVYPGWALLQKVGALSNRSEAHLDGAAFVRTGRPDDWALIEWLREAEPGVIVEKVGGSYSADNVFSIFSGQPTILGPTNHESQWRGGYLEIGSRENDVRTIYESKDWRRVSELLSEYDVRYVMIGSAERGAYQVAEAKFRQHLTLAFESGDCRVYFVK